MNLPALFDLFFWVGWLVMFLLIDRKRTKLARELRQVSFDRGALCGAIAIRLNPALYDEELVGSANWVNHCLQSGQPELLKKLNADFAP